MSGLRHEACLAVVSGIWGLVEGIMLLSGQMNMDAKGNLLKD